MTSVLIKSDDIGIIQQFLELGRQKFHLSMEIVNDVKPQNINTKSKWAKVADEIRGTLTNDDVKYLQDCSNEIRAGFAIRELSN
ncbi:MAG: hypothetical protein RL154_25 [Pseudomonadota bacterium]|jgi:hypothetical protein